MIDPVTRHIGVLSVAIHIPASQSLKDKRMVLKSLKDRLKSKFNVSVAELDGQDTWQRSTLGIVMIGNDNRYLDSTLQNVLSYIESFGECEICDHTIEFR